MSVSHVKVGFLALCIAVVLGAPAFIVSQPRLDALHATNIAVEHVAPATIRIARLAGTGTNVFEMTVTGSGAVAVHLPSSWKRQELRGAPLERMVGEPQEWGYVRWTMPLGATARFDMRDPGTITVHNPSNIPLTVSTVTVRGGSRTEDAFIMTDEPYVLP